MGNDKWFFIITKDHNCRGYMPANTKEEACQKLGVVMEESIVRAVSWNGEEFVESDHLEQGRLL